MPPKDEIEKRLQDVFISLGMNEQQQKQMSLLPDRAKWELILQNVKTMEQSKNKLANSPEPWIHKLKTEANSKTMEQLRVVLTGVPVTWIERFQELDGISLIFKVIETVEKKKM